jgi:integrase
LGEPSDVAEDGEGGRGEAHQVQHDARHFCMTLHPPGVPLAVIAKWLGHADAETTARLYLHSQGDERRAAGVSLGGVVTLS